MKCSAVQGKTPRKRYGNFTRQVTFPNGDADDKKRHSTRRKNSARIVRSACIILALGTSALLLVGCTATTVPPSTTPCPIHCNESYSTCRAGCPQQPLGDDPCIPNCADAYTACMLHCSGTETP